MHKLQLLNSSFYDDLASPSVDGNWGMDSSAADLLTDFTKESPIYIDDRYPAAEAIEILRRATVRLLMVVDKDQRFIGIVGFDRLNGQEMIKRISSGYRREELTVADFMENKLALRAFPYDEFVRSTVGDVMYTLESSGLHHCLIVDPESRKIRGVISAYDIAKKLGLPLNLQHEPNFADIAGVIYRQAHPDRRLAYAVN